jgi:hypothetical protein
MNIILGTPTSSNCDYKQENAQTFLNNFGCNNGYFDKTTNASSRLTLTVPCLKANSLSSYSITVL